MSSVQVKSTILEFRPNFEIDLANYFCIQGCGLCAPGALDKEFGILSS